MWVRFFSVVVVSLAALLYPAQACRCNKGGRVHTKQTLRCCMRAAIGSKFNEEAGDCVAQSISETLSGFAACCATFGFNSDCGCPAGCGPRYIDKKKKDDGEEEDAQDSGDEEDLGDEDDEEDEDNRP